MEQNNKIQQKAEELITKVSNIPYDKWYKKNNEDLTLKLDSGISFRLYKNKLIITRNQVESEILGKNIENLYLSIIKYIENTKIENTIKGYDIIINSIDEFNNELNNEINNRPI